MIELRFHRELYAGTAIDAALVRLAGYATFERAVEGDHFVVKVLGDDEKRVLHVARELENFALGLTVEKGGPDR